MLRDYQIDICSRAREAFRLHRSVMVQMPTGTGKTVVLASFLNEELGCAKILVVAHRRELVEQIRATIGRMKGVKGERLKGLNGEKVKGSKGEMGKGLQPTIVVESIQTISRRIDSVGFTPSLVVIDEAHHALAKTYRRMWEAWPEARFLGLTATPCRLNGKGFTDLFEVLLCSLTVPEFIRKGVLAPFDYVAINEGSSQQLLIDSLVKRGADGDYQVKEMNEVLNRRPSIKQLYDCYARFANGKKGIVYAVSIEHARSIAEYYEGKGVKAAAISARTPAKERAVLIERFRGWSPQGGADGLQVLVNVDIFSEGFDCPDVEFIQLARPTLSLAKYLQMVGRGLRLHREKEYCVILDNVGLVRLFGLPTRCWDWGKWFKGLKGEWLKGLKGEKVQGLKGDTSGPLSFALDALSMPSAPLSPPPAPDPEFSLVVAHGQLEELINRSMLEEWTAQQGIAEEEAEAFLDEGSRLWGLRCGGKVTVPPTYLRVFNIREGLAAVRMRDTKLAVVDLSGRTVRNLGRGVSARMCSRDFVEVSRNNCEDYIDVLSGQAYYDLPVIVSSGEPQLMRTADDGLILRLKDPFVYGRVEGMNCLFHPVKDYGYFYVVCLTRCRGNVEGYAVDTNRLVVFKGDNERAYWLYDVHADGSIEVIDRMGNAYRALPDGTREKLNRCTILERSQSVLKEIADRYRTEGRVPDGLEERKYRNSVLYSRLADKLMAIRERYKCTQLKHL